MRTQRARVVLVAAVLLMAAGSPEAHAAPSSPVPFSTSSDWLIQSVHGLYTPDGSQVLALKGSPRFEDLYLIDTSQPAFFVLTEGEGVHVARRVSGQDFVLEQVREDGQVLRPIGGVALVEVPEGRILVDLGGRRVMEGVTFDPDQDEGLPMSEPEYWWALDYWSRPAPLCTTDGECGWIGPDGRWIRPPSEELPPPMYTTPSVLGGEQIHRDGEPALRWSSKRVEFMGPGSDGLVLYSFGSDGPDTEVRRLDGGLMGFVDHPLHWEIITCAGARGQARCGYLFHQDRAAVRGSTSAFEFVGYLAPDGSMAIGPDRCAYGMSGPFHQDRALHCVDGAHWLIDREGHRLAGPWTLTPYYKLGLFKYRAGPFFSDGLAAVTLDGGWGYIDPFGQVVLPGQYDEASPFRLGVATVRVDGKIFHINKKGERIFGPPTIPAGLPGAPW